MADKKTYKIPVTHYQPCPVCNGVGFFVTNPDALGGWLDCPNCRGKGSLSDKEVEAAEKRWRDEHPFFSKLLKNSNQ